MPRRKMFDAHNATASAEHVTVYGRYEKAYTLIDFLAAAMFVVGSALLFSSSDQYPATWSFLIGSMFFAARPTDIPS